LAHTWARLPATPASRHQCHGIAGAPRTSQPAERYADARALSAALAACMDAGCWTQQDARVWWTGHQLPKAATAVASTATSIAPTIRLG
jgi:hypothetical protein